MPHIIKLSVRQQIKYFKKTILQPPHFPFPDILSTDSLQQLIDSSPRKRNGENPTKSITSLMAMERVQDSHR